MPFHLRFLDGGIVKLEQDKLDTIDIVRAVGEYTSEPEKGYLGAFKDQIIICKDQNMINIMIKPIFEIPYVNGFDVSQYYLKNDDAINLHPNKVIWVNDIIYSGIIRHYEIISWNAEKNTSTIHFHDKKEDLKKLHDSDKTSPIAKERLFYLISNFSTEPIRL